MKTKMFRILALMLGAIILMSSVVPVMAAKKSYSYSVPQIEKLDKEFKSQKSGYYLYKFGSSNKASLVKAVQVMLTELNYANLDYDSTYGSKTAAAVKTFQKKNGLTQDSCAGPATWKKLVAEYKKAITKTEKTTSSTSLNTNQYKNLKDYSLKGVKYYVIKNFNTKYCFDQTDYSRFCNSSGRNVGCTATACSIVLCMAGERNSKNQLITPKIYPWNGTCSWNYMTAHSSKGKATYLKQIAQEVLNGKAVAMWANDYHCVAVIGFKKNANLNNLKASDILIVDPYGGSITTLDKAQRGGYVYYGYKFYTAN